MDILFYILIIILSLGGMSLSYYIYRKKEQKKSMVCPLNFECDSVVNSQYSKFLGLRLEYLGMLYYGFIALAYLLLILVPSLLAPIFVFLMIVFTALAFLFSIYLTLVQMVALREWCTWCLISAAISTAIFAVIVFATEFGFQQLFIEHHIILLIGYFLALALGAGATTIGDMLFFRFLRDLNISHDEAEILHITYQVIWFALGAVLLTIAGLKLVYWPSLSIDDGVVWLKIGVILILVVNTFLLNLYISPKLSRASLSKEKKTVEHFRHVHNIRKIAFALNALSIPSWYFLVVLEVLRDMEVSANGLVITYLSLFLVSIGVSQYIDRNFDQRNSELLSKGEQESEKEQ